MAPAGRSLALDPGFRDAAVLIALAHRHGRWEFPLILRAEDSFSHGGQIGLPGGRREGAESAEMCALRESNEEIGLPATGVRVIGRLSPLPVPVSRHIIQPFVGVVTSDVQYRPDPREVQAVLAMPVARLVDPDAPREGGIIIRSLRLTVPMFDLDGHPVWGATAMILSEFREILRQLQVQAQ
ncbi:MAG: putative Nudix hydrolase NudL [Calditrichaeota bacterium]|nr:putative Nudix hydrolase NudL [Calditrichota bacterium]